MKNFTKSFLLLLLSLVAYQAQAQHILRIHKTNGQIINIPTDSIDSIDFVTADVPVTPPNVSVTHGYMEVPAYSGTYQQPHIKYLTHSFTYNHENYRNYEMLFDTRLKIAYWVAYPLCDFYTQPNAKRSTRFIYDPSLPKKNQAHMSKGLLYYSDNGRYDRGHQIPSADRLVSKEANIQTFYFTNMTAQIGKKLNQSIWGNLEEQVRKWSKTTDTLYVVTGAMPTTPKDSVLTFTQDNDGVNICVPKYYFKALCKINRQTGEAKTIAFKLDHREYKSGDTYMNYTLSVAELEKLTGFVFFPGIATKYKQSYRKKDW